MNRTVILLIVFLLLGFGAYVLLNKADSKSSIDITYDTKFTVDDIEDVHKIFIANRKGDRTTLTRNGNNWTLSDGSRVRKYPIDFILNCLQNLEYKYLLSKPEGQYAAERLAINGIKVEVYDKADKNLLTFYIGPNANDHEGSYMIKEGSDKPQIMNLPGHVGELRTIFDMSGDEWKDRTLYALDKKNIKSIAIEYPKQKSKSFKLNLDGEKSKIIPLDKYATTINKPLNESSISAYLDEFELKIAENFKNNLKGDSVLNVIPFAIITIEKKDGTKDIIDYVPSISSLTNDEGVPYSGNAAMMRYFAVRKDGDVFLTQHHVLKGIFRSYDSFF